MCFSASASFGTAALLFATGGMTTALARTDQERPFAAIPLLFGIQQLIEGLIWMGLGRG